MVSVSHVGVLPFPFGSHVPPLLALLHQLARFAPQIRFSFFTTADSKLLVGADRMSNNIRVYQVWDGAPPGRAFTGTYFDAIGLFLRASPGNFENAIQEAERDAGLGVGCLIVDAFMSSACDRLAEKMKIPWVAFWASGTFTLSAHVYTREIVRSTTLTGTTWESQNQVVSFIPPGQPTHLQLADLPPGIFLDTNPAPLDLAIHSMVEVLPKSAAIVLNAFEEMDPIVTQDLKLKFNHILHVRPEMLANQTPQDPDDKTGCLPWLDKQTRPKSVIYIAFGKFSDPPQNELMALAEALEDHKLPFLWSLKDSAKKWLPVGFLERSKEFGRIVAWAPQPQILRHASVGVFVNHGGWNSILESISGCVPMICRPFFGDQNMNSIMVEEMWKIGVRLKERVLSKGGIIEALDRVMRSEDGNGIRENMVQMRQKMVDDVGSDGSSTKNFNKLLEIVVGGAN